MNTDFEAKSVTAGVCLGVTVLLISLKLQGWTPELSWFWVLAPLWVPAVLIVAFTVLLMISYAVDAR